MFKFHTPFPKFHFQNSIPFLNGMERVFRKWKWGTLFWGLRIWFFKKKCLNSIPFHFQNSIPFFNEIAGEFLKWTFNTEFFKWNEISEIEFHYEMEYLNRMEMEWHLGDKILEFQIWNFGIEIWNFRCGILEM